MPLARPVRIRAGRTREVLVLGLVTRRASIELRGVAARVAGNRRPQAPAPSTAAPPPPPPGQEPAPQPRDHAHRESPRQPPGRASRTSSITRASAYTSSSPATASTAVINSSPLTTPPPPSVTSPPRIRTPPPVPPPPALGHSGLACDPLSKPSRPAVFWRAALPHQNSHSARKVIFQHRTDEGKTRQAG